MDQEKNKNRIIPSTYTALDDLTSLVSKYFDIDEANMLKSGFLGSLIEMNAHLFKHSVHHKNFLYDEFFPNTAKLPKSVYNFAKITNYKIGSARPAVMSIAFTIDKRTVIEKGEPQEDGSIIFTISKDSPFTIRNFNYLLSNDVQIIATRNEYNRDYAITAVYDLQSSHNFPFAKLKSPYIKSWVESIESVDYIIMNLDIWQVRKETRTFKVLSRDVTDIKSFMIEHDDQLAHFNTYYKYPTNKPRRVLPVFFNNIFTPDDLKEFGFYNYYSDDELQIYFPGLPKTFNPAFNSEIEIDYFTTKGTAGNFEYMETAQIGFAFNDSKFHGVDVLVRSASDSNGARDKETLKEIKKSVIRENFHRNNLATDKDLNNFFKNVVDSRSVNGSDIQFYKKRDDVIRRIYGAYLLLKNSNGLTVPTNTVDLELEYRHINSLNNRLETGTTVVFDPDSRRHRLLRADESVDTFSSSSRALVYSIPYLVRTHLDPVPRIAYYNNAIDKNIPLAFSRINLKSNREFLLNSLEITRNSMLGEQYEFTISLSTNMPLDHMEDVKLIGSIKDSNGRIYGFIEFELFNKISSAPIQYIYKARVLTEDKFDKHGRLEIINTIRDMVTGDTKSKVNLPENLSMSIALMYDKMETKEKYNEFEHIQPYRSYTTLFIVDTLEEFSLARALDGMLHSDMEINNNGILRIRNVPVVASKYFTKKKNFSEFYRIIDVYFDMIYNSLDNIQNNTSIDVKFFNTYGLSELHSIDTVNLDIEFRINLSDNLFIEQTDKKIRELIVDYVDESNETGLFSVSNLITELKNNIKEIRYIEFVSLNGLPTQKVEKLEEYKVLDDLSREEVIKFTPEYINIMHDFEDESKEARESIKITYI